MSAVADEIRLESLPVHTGEAAFARAMDSLRNDVLQIPPPLLPSEWISQNVRLANGESSKSGQVTLRGYQREPANRLMDPDCSQVTVRKGTQVGWSMLTSFLTCYSVTYLGSRVIYVQPTDDDAQGFYDENIDPRTRDIPAFAAIIRTPARGQPQDKWDLHMYRNGGILYMRGAASDDAARRIKGRHIFCDEVNAEAWQGRGGEKDQGNKFDLFRERGTDFWDSKVYAGSSPTHRDTIGEKAWQESTKGVYHVPCPHCGQFQELVWGGPKIKHGFKYDVDARGVVTRCWYVCVHCEKDIDETEKVRMDDLGHYVHQIPKVPGNYGYHWPQWLSQAPKANWANIAQRWLAAQGDPEKLKAWINNFAGEPWDDLSGGGMDADAAHAMTVPYPAEVPDDVVVMTAGVDTQTNKEGSEIETIASREVTVVGWSRHEMPRVIGHWIVAGEPGTPDADAALDAILQRGFRKRDGSEHFVQASANDMGGHFGDATKLYAHQRIKRNVWAIKGKNNALGSRSPAVWPKKVSRDKAKGMSFYMIDTQLAKDAVGRKLKVTGPDGPTFPSSLPEDYFKGLTAEKFVVDKRGRKFWMRKSKANTGEPWDCLIYSYAALCGLKQSFLRWRDLNVAADRAGISRDPAHDPETGEISDAYGGPDRSAQAEATDIEPATEARDAAPAAPPMAPVRVAASEPPAPPPPPPSRPPPVVRRPRAMRVSRWG
ncbi:terminase gpA endonuclease subunit [Aureimonas sp. SK2]|uniref:terminase gpA endonuclease subunit n=1 Tax=Aureimonas sp. SK2 TaxID=3015992 RepID=UPI002445137C|nr:terminase gpA endonuclease subunit [Aureimonas sp. SK2]